MRLVLTGQLCSGKNRVQVTRAGRHYPTKRFVAWRAEACQQLKPQLKGVKPFTEPVVLSVEYWPGDVRTRDLSGMMDALFYLLVFTGVLVDDGLVWHCAWKRYPINRQFPKVILDVQEAPR